MKRIFMGVTAAIVLFLFSGIFTPTARADDTKDNLLVSTELLLIAQANLAILSLDLISTNMQHDYTTADDDHASLQTILDSLDLSKSTISGLLSATDISDNDKQLLRLMDKSTASLISATAELQGYLVDGKDDHFNNFADDMNDVATNMDNAGKLLE